MFHAYTCLGHHSVSMSHSITILQLAPASVPVLAATEVKVGGCQYVGGSQSRDMETSNFLSHSFPSHSDATDPGRLERKNNEGHQGKRNA